MKIRKTPTGIELRSTPGGMWGLGLWFVAGGTLCLAMAAFVPGDLTLRDRLIASFIGLGVLSGGLWSLSTSPAIRLTLNMMNRTVQYVRKAPLRRRVVVCAGFDQVSGVDVTVTHDSDGDPWHEVVLLVEGREPLLLGGGPAALRPELVTVRETIRSGLRGSRAALTEGWRSRDA